MVLASHDATWTLTRIGSTSFFNNIAAVGNGGALSLSSGIHLLNQTIFEQNTAATAGGALALEHSCTDTGTFFGEPFGITWLG